MPVSLHWFGGFIPRLLLVFRTLLVLLILQLKFYPSTVICTTWNKDWLLKYLWLVYIEIIYDIIEGRDFTLLTNTTFSRNDSDGLAQFWCYKIVSLCSNIYFNVSSINKTSSWWYILFFEFWYLATFPSRHGFIFTPGRFFSLSVAENQHFKFRVVQPPILIQVAPLQYTFLVRHQMKAGPPTDLTSNMMSTFLWLILLFAVIHLNSFLLT